MKQQTAVKILRNQILADALALTDGFMDFNDFMNNTIRHLNQAKEIEKLQITHAHKAASLEAGFEHSADDWAEQYYTNTYGQ